MDNEGEGIQVMHEMTIEGYRITVFKKSGEFIMTWLMTAEEGLDMAHTITKTVIDHYNGIIKIVKENTNE